MFAVMGYSWIRRVVCAPYTFQYYEISIKAILLTATICDGTPISKSIPPVFPL